MPDDKPPSQAEPDPATAEERPAAEQTPVATAAPTSPEAVTAPTTPAAPKRSALAIGLWALLAVVLLAGVGAFALYRWRAADPLRGAAAGDCVAGLPAIVPAQEMEIDSARVVACSDPDATHKVEARLEGRTEDQAKSDCADYPSGVLVITTARGEAKGYVLCLSEASPS